MRNYNLVLYVQTRNGISVERRVSLRSRNIGEAVQRATRGATTPESTVTGWRFA